MDTLKLESFERVNDQVIKVIYAGSSQGAKTHLSFNVHLRICPNKKDPDDRVEATIDFDGKCAARDIESVFRKLGDWCGRISHAVGACQPDQVALPLRFSIRREGLDTDCE